MPGPLDLILGLTGRPDPASMLRAQAGAPSPPPDAGSAPQPGQAPSTQPQAYATDPTLAGMNQQLSDPMQLMRAYLDMRARAQAGAGLMHGLGLMAASFGGAPTNIHNIMQATQGGAEDDSASVIGNIMKINEYSQMMNRYNTLLAHPDIYAKALGMTPEQLTASARLVGPEGLGPIMAKIAENRMGIGGDPTIQEMNRAKQVYMDQNGITDPADPRIPDQFRYPEKYKATTQEQTKIEVAAGQDRLNAKETFPTIEPQYKAAMDNIEWLNQHPDATVNAIHMGDLASNRSGQIMSKWFPSNWAPDEQTLEARRRLDLMNNEQFRQGMASVKNVRSQMEANKIGGSITTIDNTSNPSASIITELKRIRDMSRSSYANLAAAAGKPIPEDLHGLADRSYFDPKSPLYNGATEPKSSSNEAATQGTAPAGKQMTADDMAQAKSLIGQHGRDWVVNYLKTKGYDTSGL
jgi:hypothetical protein